MRLSETKIDLTRMSCTVGPSQEYSRPDKLLMKDKQKEQTNNNNSNNQRIKQQQYQNDVTNQTNEHQTIINNTNYQRVAERLRI